MDEVEALDTIRAHIEELESDGDSGQPQDLESVLHELVSKCWRAKRKVQRGDD